MKRFCCCCCTRAAVVSFQAAGKCGTAQVREVATERSGGTTRARATLSPSLKLKLSRIFLCVLLVRVSVRRVGARAGGVCRWRTRGAAPLPAAHGHARRAPRAPGSSAGGFGPLWTAAGCLGPPQTPAGGWPLSHRTPPNAALLRARPTRGVGSQGAHAEEHSLRERRGLQPGRHHVRHGLAGEGAPSGHGAELVNGSSTTTLTCTNARTNKVIRDICYFALKTKRNWKGLAQHFVGVGGWV